MNERKKERISVTQFTVKAYQHHYLLLLMNKPVFMLQCVMDEEKLMDVLTDSITLRCWRTEREQKSQWEIAFLLKRSIVSLTVTGLLYRHCVYLHCGLMLLFNNSEAETLRSDSKQWLTRQGSRD